MTANISNTVTIIAPMVVNIVKKISDIVHGLQTRWFCYLTLRNVGLIGGEVFFVLNLVGGLIRASREPAQTPPPGPLQRSHHWASLRYF